MISKDSVSASEVKALLESRRGDWPAICLAAGVSHSWISKFVRGHIDNPGYLTLRNLREHLLKKKVRTEPEGA
jgi:hypothetical protein